jgi:natural product precursor
MKKMKLAQKISLNKEIIAKLNQEEMNHVKGGDLGIISRWPNCSIHDTCIMTRTK